MIYKIASLVTAEAVVNGLMNNEHRADIRAYVECYQNGREHGFILYPFYNNKKNTVYYICEGRRSDQICIYKGSYTLQSISDDAYAHPNYFGRDFDAAIEWLSEEIKQFKEEPTTV